ncbi:MAG: tyrosine--tRNA ligase [Oscillospiraceae bacterium]|nr:tyrosine--tRNA ligase [Oscillospiraceae bacterium]
MSVFQELQARGLIAQMTDEKEIQELLDNGGAKFYIGFDATADSLHVGHMVQLIIMRHLQMAGNIPVFLLGGGTTMIGDPSGRTDMRQMMTMEQIEHNGQCFVRQAGKILDFSEGKAMLVNNADWLLDLKYIDLLREVGAHFSVNRMLTAEAYKARWEKGLSFFEFNYMIMQSYDFYVLYKQHSVELQCGGDDQWSNILAGTELIRKKTAADSGGAGEDAYGMTFKLLLTSTGQKMGKTMSGAVWLDPEKTSPFEFYQYWRNIDDADVINCLKMLTFVPVSEIEEMAKWEGGEINRAKEILAFELTALVHSPEEAEKAAETAKALFSAGGAADMPTVTLSAADLTDGVIDILALLVKAELTPSKSEARRAVEQGGVEAAGAKVDSFSKSFTQAELEGEGIILRRGKKKFCRVVLG